ncbi:hypothetical protein ACKKBF_B02745 [Auxenochlorella protothecoides x Auxenochlorella symbiontica]
MTNRESWADAVDDEEVEGPSTLHSDSAGRPRYETREGWDESADVKRGVSRQRLDLTHGFHREIVKNQKLRSQYEQECREGMAKASDYQKRWRRSPVESRSTSRQLESVAPPQDVENVTTAPRHRPETRVREGFAAYRPPPALGSQPKLDLDRNGKAERALDDQRRPPAQPHRGQAVREEARDAQSTGPPPTEPTGRQRRGRGERERRRDAAGGEEHLEARPVPRARPGPEPRPQHAERPGEAAGGVAKVRERRSVHDRLGPPQPQHSPVGRRGGPAPADPPSRILVVPRPKAPAQQASAPAQDVPEQESSAGGEGVDAVPAEPGAEAKPRRSRRGGRKRHPRRQEGGEAAAHERGAAGGHGDEGAAEAQTDETLASHAVADVGSEVTDSPGSAEEWLGGSAAPASGSEVGAAVSGPPPGVGAPPPESKDDATAAVPAGDGAGPAPASPRSAEAGGAAAPAAVQPRDPSQERGEAADLGAASALPGLQGVIDGTKLIDLKADEAKAGGDGRPQNCSIQ